MAVVIPPHAQHSPSREAKKKEIYRYAAPWTVYGMNWSVRQDRRFQLAMGSFIEDYTNKIQIIDLDEERGEFVLKATFDHPYPATKIMWIPDQVRRGRWECEGCGGGGELVGETELPMAKFPCMRMCVLACT